MWGCRVPQNGFVGYFAWRYDLVGTRTKKMLNLLTCTNLTYKHSGTVRRDTFDDENLNVTQRFDLIVILSGENVWSPMVLNMRRSFLLYRGGKTQRNARKLSSAFENVHGPPFRLRSSAAFLFGNSYRTNRTFSKCGFGSLLAISPEAELISVRDVVERTIFHFLPKIICSKLLIFHFWA